jgi:Mn-dependent DtxR family transcriptional regulator
LTFKFCISIFEKKYNLRTVRKVRVSPNLVKKIIKSNNDLTFCYFLKLKYLHTNSTIYNFSLRKAAADINVSPSSIKNHFNKMKKLGYVRVVKNKTGGKNVTFISMSKLCKMHDVRYSSKSGYIVLKQRESIQELKTAIYYKVIANNIKKQKFAIQGKSNSVMRKRNQLKKVERTDSLYNSLLNSIASERITPETYLCCETIGKMIGKTKMTGYNQLKKMARMGLVFIEKKYKTVLDNCTPEEFEMLVSHGELKRGQVFYKRNESKILKSVGFKISTLM